MTLQASLLLLCGLHLLVKADINVRGAGASFPYTVYKSWMPSYSAYRQQHVAVKMTYNAIGSGNGKAKIKQNEDIEYAGSDSLLNDEDFKQYPDLVMFPTMAGAVVVSYNLPHCKVQLNLTRIQIVGIFNGTYRYWNESTFQDLNPHCDMPHEQFKVIVRADKSGTTELFTESLAAFSDDWKTQFGKFSVGVDKETDNPIKWDKDVIHLSAEKNGGMSGLISSIKYSVGYLSVADAQQINYAKVENRQGNLVNPTSAAVQGAMDYAAQVSQLLMTSLADGDRPEAYPMAGYTYFIVHKTAMTNCDSAREFLRYVDWFMNTPKARQDCEQSKMTPLSQVIVDRVTEQVLTKITCKGQNVWEQVLELKAIEETVEATWKIPVAVTVPLFLIITCCLLGYIIRQKLRLNAMINKNEWDIAIEDIIFYFDEKGASTGKSKLLGMKSIKSLKSVDDIPEGSDLLLQILQWPGKYKGNIIGIRMLEIKELKLINREMKKEMLWMRDNLHHVNVVRFFGLSELDCERYVIGEYCGKGSMTDILKDEKYNLNNDFKFSLAFDITAGMAFLHSNGVVHGHLTSTRCFVDSRWTVKIGDWEYIKLLQHARRDKNPFVFLHKTSYDIGKRAAAFQDFWVAPEVLRSELEMHSTQSGDVYSFAIILQEIFTREDPYVEHVDHLSPEQVIRAVVDNGLRPQPSDDTPMRVRQIMEIAWSETPVSRPSFDQITKMLRQSRQSRKSVLDSMMEAMEEYTDHLEARIEERTSELFVAKSNIQHMLKDVIPPHLISKLSNGESIETKVHALLGIVVVEIVNMADLVENSSAQDIIVYLNDTHCELEKTFSRYDAYRTNMQGDTFTVTLGFNKDLKNELKCAEEIPHLCLDLVNVKNKVQCPDNFHQEFELKIVAHVGSVVTGVIGTGSPKFVALGETIELVKLLSQVASSQKCLLSKPVQALIEQSSTFDLEEGESINFKEQLIQTYWLTGRHCSFVDVSSDTSTDSGIDTEAKHRPNSRESDKSNEDVVVTDETDKTTNKPFTSSDKRNSKIWRNKPLTADSSKRKSFKDTEKPNFLRSSKNRIAPVIEECTEL